MIELLGNEDHALLMEFACVQEVLGFDIGRMEESGLVEFADTLTGRKVVWGMGMTKAQVLLAVQGIKRIMCPEERVPTII